MIFQKRDSLKKHFVILSKILLQKNLFLRDTFVRVTNIVIHFVPHLIILVKTECKFFVAVPHLQNEQAEIERKNGTQKRHYIFLTRELDFNERPTKLES